MNELTIEQAIKILNAVIHTRIKFVEITPNELTQFNSALMMINDFCKEKPKGSKLKVAKNEPTN